MMTMTFEFPKDVVRIRNPNWRKELRGADDKQQTVDLSLEYTGDRKIIDQLSVDVFEWSKLLWQKGAKLNVGLPSWIKFNRTFRDHRITLFLPNEDSLTFDEARITDFEAQPHNDNQVELRFQVQLHVTPEDMEFLAWCYDNEMIHLQVTPPAQMESELQVVG